MSETAMRLLELLRPDPSRPLLFNSGTFFFLLTAFLAVHALLRGRQQARLVWLLAFSLYYYFRSNAFFVLALLGLAACDWAIALKVGAEERASRRKAWLATSVALNLLALGYFKYTNFFLGNVASAAGVPFRPFDIFLPLGISFHVFQSLSYLVDVYRRRYAPTRSLFEYTLFLCFFPQIVAGPIVRAPEFFSQIRPLSDPSPDDISSGLFRVIQGVVKKALIADYVGLYADVVFGAPGTYSGPEVLIAVYAYSIQIYFDFSGYSDMALGMARMLGVRISENFDAPYRATSITEFWRRWHISLSTWLKEYLYVSLGGNRHGKARQTASLMITMLLGGLWHGASWTFVLWGGLHGVGLAMDKVISERSRWRASTVGRAVGWIVTLHFVAALWIFFRAQSLGSAIEIFSRLASGWDLGQTVAVLRARQELVTVVGLGFLMSLVPSPWVHRAERWFGPLPAPVKACALLFVVQAALQVASAEVQPFIYFQF